MTLSTLIISSCANVKVRNQEWCADKGPFGAKCFNTLNKEERDIPKAVWDKIDVGADHRFGKVCTDIENFTDTKAIILNLCKATKRCTYDMKKKVVTFVEKLNDFRDEADEFALNFLGEDANGSL